MPRMRENLKLALSKTDEESGLKSKYKLKKDKEKFYSPRSPVLKAYKEGIMPIDHRRLLDAIKHELGEGVREGEIKLERALENTGYFRASALKMLQHMKNFGVLDTESKYRATWVKLLND